MNSDVESNFELLQPKLWITPAVFSVPHAGSILPDELCQQSRLNAIELRQSEDAYVDELFSASLDIGAVMLRTKLSRAWVDVNRAPYELDAKMFVEALPAYMNPNAPRVAAGYGTIPRLSGDNLEIYCKRLTLAQALARIETHYKPYHRSLNALLHQSVAATGFALLVDCHSMPSNSFKPNGKHADLVIGDRFGASCDSAISYAIEDFFTAYGLSVQRNHPYAGGFITETYGAPRHGKHAIQLEFNRAIYMNEATLKKTKSFDDLKKLCDSFCLWLSDMLKSQSMADVTRAAE